MKVLLAHNSLYYPSHGGGDKSNRLLMEALAERGHTVRVVTRVERFGPSDQAKLIADLAARGVPSTTTDEGIVRFELNGVDVHVVALQPNVRAVFTKQIAGFDPDVIITSTDDPGQLLFDLAVRAPRARVVHLVRATIAVPFGPDSSSPNSAKTELLKHADGIVGVSEYVAQYVRSHGGIDAIHVPISLLDPVIEYPSLASFDNRFVSIANPCAVKGIDIFLALADRMPHVEFAAFPTWGTTDADKAELHRRRNISVLSPVDNIDDLLRITKVLLVPSVWAEARSRIVVEAMTRGVPVISSNAGGIPEAHLGVDYMIPVNVITRYKPSLDPNMVPVPEVPPQDIDPWKQALERLVSDRSHWEDISRQSRDAALNYAANLNVGPFEAYLKDLLQRPRKAPPAAQLSEEKRKLLALRLKQKSGANKPRSNLWLAGLEATSPDRLALFCFPYAGGGTLTYLSWKDALKGGADIVAVRPPARESRIRDAPFEDMDGLLEALHSEIEPHLESRRFAFFGHSMGAGIAFELARRLENTRPELLIVSSAKAPRYRRQPSQEPDPSDSELLERVRALEGIPGDVLDNPALLELALPALRADTRLYRRHFFRPGKPLPVPIVAYGGESDPNLAPELLSGWADETQAEFKLRSFPGGHFYFNNPNSGFFEALLQDLKRE
jgi:surfactin synthase thioesterase subunit/glycosyltransferase involved in cell wall biosynthesis